jgi:peptidyl-arginine deiminase
VSLRLKIGPDISEISEDPGLQKLLHQLNPGKEAMDPEAVTRIDHDKDGYIDKNPITKTWSQFQYTQVQNALWRAGVLKGHIKTDQPPAVLKEFFQQAGHQSPTFTPEYDYRRFFFVHDRSVLDSANPDERPQVLREQSFLIRRTQDAETTLSSLHQEFPQLSRSTLAKRVHFILDFDRGEYWAQDFGEPTGGAQSTFVVGWPPGDASTRKFQDREKINLPQNRVLKIPALLQGGNFTKTLVHGKKVVVVGGADIRNTQLQYLRRFDYEISENQVREIYRQAFGADQVLVLQAKQKKHSFHIDQAVFFPKPDVAILAIPTVDQNSSKEAVEFRHMVDSYRQQLKKSGFQILEIPTTEAHIKAYQAYTNGIPLQTPTGTQLILPSFGDTVLEPQIKAKLEKAGLKVMFVPNASFKKEGNTHCITGSLG